MNRRRFLTTLGAASLMKMPSLARAEADHEAASGQSDEIPLRVAGIRMVPVRSGKYKVWTKKVGRGRVKVLLLHGGPGMSHEYLESFESFLPEAALNTSTTTSSAAITQISPAIRGCGRSKDTCRRLRRSDRRSGWTPSSFTATRGEEFSRSSMRCVIRSIYVPL